MVILVSDMEKGIPSEEVSPQSQEHELKGNVYSEDRELGDESMDIARIEKVYRYVSHSGQQSQTDHVGL